MRKFLLILLAIGLLFGLVACSSEEKTNADASLTGVENTVEESNLKEEIVLYNATDFSEGKSVVVYKNIENANYCNAGLLNSDGSIKEIEDVYIAIEEIEEDDDEITTPVNWSGLQNGYAYIDYTDKISDANVTYKRFVILDANGNVTAISPLDADYTILCGGDGVFLVQQQTKGSLNVSSTTNLGIMNHEGEWICPLSAPDTYYSNNLNAGSIEYRYCGERVFAFICDRLSKNEGKYWLSLFHADTKKTVEFDGMELLTNFDQGYALLAAVKEPKISSNVNEVSINTTEIYTVDKDDFNTRIIFSNIACTGQTNYRTLLDVEPVLSNGYIFGVSMFDNASSYNLLSGPPAIIQSCFYDVTGEEKISFPEYDCIFLDKTTNDLFAFTDDGIAVVYLDGKDGNYVTTINESGDFLYEPIKVFSCINYDVDSGNIAVKVEQNIGGETLTRNAFINSKTGELTVAEFEVNTNTKWHCGFLRDVNTFIDTNGEKLTTYIK